MSWYIFFSINCTALWFRKTLGKLDIGTGFAYLSVRNTDLIANLKTLCKKYEEINIPDHRRTVFVHLMLPFGLAC